MNNSNNNFYNKSVILLSVCWLLFRLLNTMFLCSYSLDLTSYTWALLCYRQFLLCFVHMDPVELKTLLLYFVHVDIKLSVVRTVFVLCGVCFSLMCSHFQRWRIHFLLAVVEDFNKLLLLLLLLFP
jgi:hypothetical protein